ncbi:MAG: hypothetical protein ABFS14_09840 [Gemmatimonadota bacterium]
MIRKAVILGAMVALFGVSSLAAQEATGKRGQHAGRMEKAGQMKAGGGGGPLQMMPRLQGYAPATLLGRAEELGLSAGQVTEIEEIQTHLSTVRTETEALHKEHKMAMKAALAEEEPDAEAVGNHLQAAHAAKGMLHWTEVDSSLKAMAVLSAEQKGLVEK